MPSSAADESEDEVEAGDEGSATDEAADADDEAAADAAAEAEDRDAEAREDVPEKAAPKAAASRDAKGNVKLGEVEIRGELEKPKIFFILPKAQREAENRQRRIRFYPDILEPLDKDRFEEEARVLYQHGIPAE